MQIEAQAPIEGRSKIWKSLAKLRKYRWFAIFVVAPTLLAFIYYGFIASDIFVSESRFVVKSPDRKQSTTSSLASLIQTTGLSAGQEQTNEILDYLRSRDALIQLSQHVNVEKRFSRPDADVLSRYPRPFDDRSFETLYKFYGSMVNVKMDHDTGNAVLMVKAFDPRDGQILNENLLQLAEGLVNRLNARANSRGVEEAQRQVEQAEMRVRNARVQIASYRNSSGLLDPESEARGILEVSTPLVAQRAQLQAQYDATLRAAPDNPSLPALRQQIAQISRQISNQGARAVGNPSGIASKLAGYEALAVEQEFATQMLTAASARLEQARGEVQKQQFYLERVVSPNAPDEALLPARLKQILTVLAVSLCLYLVGWMLIVGILEHSPDD